MRGPWWPRLVQRSCAELPAPFHTMHTGAGGGPRCMATRVDPSVSRSSRRDPRLLALADESGYEVQGRIGAGGMGIVYRAHAADGNDAAIKMLRPEISDDRRARERL